MQREGRGGEIIVKIEVGRKRQWRKRGRDYKTGCGRRSTAASNRVGETEKVCVKGRRSEGGEERRGEKVLARGD